MGVSLDNCPVIMIKLSRNKILEERSALSFMFNMASVVVLRARL